MQNKKAWASYFYKEIAHLDCSQCLVRSSKILICLILLEQDVFCARIGIAHEIAKQLHTKITKLRVGKIGHDSNFLHVQKKQNSKQRQASTLWDLANHAQSMNETYAKQAMCSIIQILVLKIHSRCLHQICKLANFKFNALSHMTMQ